jgi:ligand-binding SRPBCC domain-containing protein
MPVFEAVTLVPCPPRALFEFLARPANLPLVSPPELHLRLVDGPERLSLGSRITVQGSRFGIPQRITSEVTAFEEGVGFTDAQVAGPFGKFVHTHRVEPADGGSRMTDRFDFEAPGGLLGWYLTDARIRRDLGAVAAFRAARFPELLRGA